MNKPLVTFVLFSYNQERFIREAVRGALSQTYTPLQIIISDDCSRDGTFDVIQDEVAFYSGPHTVLLNRNEHNLGIGGHVNRAMELAEGKLIVAAAGDDVSLPTRTEELARAWSEGGVFSVYSNYITVDENGVESEIKGNPTFASEGSLQETVRSRQMLALGCTHAWDRSVFSTFGPLLDGTVSEDVVIPFRAKLLGKIAYVDKYLVKYRTHDTNVWKPVAEQMRWNLPKYKSCQAEQAQRRAKNFENWLHDVKLFSSVYPRMRTELLCAREVIAAKIAYFKFKEAALKGRKTGGVRNYLRTLRDVRRLGTGSVVQIGLLSVSPTIYCRLQRWRFKKLTPGRKWLSAIELVRDRKPLQSLFGDMEGSLRRVHDLSGSWLLLAGMCILVYGLRSFLVGSKQKGKSEFVE